MCDRARGFAKVGDQLGDLARECFGLGRPIERLAELGGGDQLHRASDLANVLDRLAALDDRSGLGHQLHRGGDPCLQAWGGAASFQERKLSKRNRRVSRRGRTNDRKMPTNGRAGPRILSSGLRGRLRRAHARSVGRPVVGLGAASSGPDWRSIRDVLSVARFASALVPKHQSPLVNTCVRLALLQAPSFSYQRPDTGLKAPPALGGSAMVVRLTGRQIFAVRRPAARKSPKDRSVSSDRIDTGTEKTGHTNPTRQRGTLAEASA